LLTGEDLNHKKTEKKIRKKAYVSLICLLMWFKANTIEGFCDSVSVFQLASLITTT